MRFFRILEQLRFDTVHYILIVFYITPTYNQSTCHVKVVYLVFAPDWRNPSLRLNMLLDDENIYVLRIILVKLNFVFLLLR